MGSWIRVTLISLAVLGAVVMTFNLRAGLLRLSGYSTSDDGELMLPHIKEAIDALSSRVCGSPAVHGYAHVVPECLETSPTTVYWRKWMQEGGTPESLVAHIEHHADYDGLAVGWGIGNTKSSAEECAEACRNHKPGPQVGGPFGLLPCNAFAVCLPAEGNVCFAPDAHTHSRGDCWLKFTEGPANPEVNFRGKLSPDFKKRHPNAPDVVQWHAGVLLPPGLRPTNGTWSPRYSW